MSTKVKGLLKGLRYISQIFDEKEEEIQIGFPTDVKHVAHIGSDDPSANAPSWMNEYKATSEPSPGTKNATEKLEEHKNNSSSKASSKIRHLIPKSRHHSLDSESNGNSESATKHKHTRRHRSSDPSAESSVHDSSGGSRHSRRHRRGSNHGSESPSQDGTPPTATKHSHRRKSKTTSSEDGSVRKPSSSRTSRRSSKGDSLTDISFTDLGSGPGPGTGTENGQGSK